MNFDYSGFFFSLPCNVPLSVDDCERQLKQQQKLDYSPWPAWSVIKINSTYLEIVDKHYLGRGFAAFFTLLACALAVFLGTVQIYISMMHRISSEYRGNPGLVSIFAGLLLGAFLLYGLVRFFLKWELFSYTHFPIRLNRKNRTVYVMRRDGSLLGASWDDIFFTISKGDKSTFGLNQYWNIRGHILDKERKVIQESFSFSVVDRSDDNTLLAHWEFLRRYMEEGPRQLSNQVSYCWPIADVRESMPSGFKATCWNSVAGLIGDPSKRKWSIVEYIFLPIMLPIMFLWALAICAQVLLLPFRWLAMHTCKIPKWPNDVEEICKIEENDLFARDSRGDSLC